MRTGAIILAKPDKKKTISFDSRTSAYFRKKKIFKKWKSLFKVYVFPAFFPFQ